MVLAAIIGWQVAKWPGVFGAPIQGPIIVTASLSLRVFCMPTLSEAIQAAPYFIGVGIGVHPVGVTRRELRHDVAMGAAFVVILAAVFAVIARQPGGAHGLRLTRPLPPAGRPYWRA